MTCEVSRVSGNSCVPLLSDGGGGTMPNSEPITDSFTVHVHLDADPDARPGEVWFCDIKHGSPQGFVVDYHGTIVPGGNADAAFSIKAQAGQSFGVQATAHLPHVNLNASAGGSADMRVNCDPPRPPTGPRRSGPGRSGGGSGSGGRSGGSYVPPP